MSRLLDIEGAGFLILILCLAYRDVTHTHTHRSATSVSTEVNSSRTSSCYGFRQACKSRPQRVPTQGVRAGKLLLASLCAPFPDLFRQSCSLKHKAAFCIKIWGEGWTCVCWGPPEVAAQLKTGPQLPLRAVLAVQSFAVASSFTYADLLGVMMRVGSWVSD